MAPIKILQVSLVYQIEPYFTTKRVLFIKSSRILPVSYQIDTTKNKSYKTETQLPVSYQIDTTQNKSYQIDTHLPVSYQIETHLPVSYQIETHLPVSYRIDPKITSIVSNRSVFYQYRTRRNAFTSIVSN